MSRSPRGTPAGAGRAGREPRTSWRPWHAVAALLAVLLWAAGCARAPLPPRTAALPVPAPRPLLSKPGAGLDLLGIVGYSLSLQGVPYVDGGESPERGFDCSGFVRHVYGRLGIDLPRDTRSMAAVLSAAPLTARRPGDLVFFDVGRRPKSHVGIYLGDERFIHAPSTRTGHIMVSSLGSRYWGKRLSGVRRAHLR